MFDKNVVNCGLCLHTNKSGYLMTYNHFFDFHVCSDCLEKAEELLLKSEECKNLRVTSDFRVPLDSLRRSTEEDFLLRNKILNVLLAGNVKIKDLNDLITFALTHIGTTRITKEPMKFSVSNILSDVIGRYKGILQEYNKEVIRISRGRLIDLRIEPNASCEMADMKMLRA